MGIPGARPNCPGRSGGPHATMFGRQVIGSRSIVGEMLQLIEDRQFVELQPEVLRLLLRPLFEPQHPESGPRSTLPPEWRPRLQALQSPHPPVLSCHHITP